MQKEQWRELKEIFERVCDLGAAEAQAYLDETCPTGTELRTELESLLSAYRSAGDFIQTPAIIDHDIVADENEDPLIGSDLGTYRITREINRGGMGTVYEALRADDEYQKLVAVKIVQRGLDTKIVLSRFRNERQILANLDHPNIARLLDGGTTKDGRPYFVMEFVDGIPIDEYCDRHQLKIGARLRLFQTVSKAVHYAHQHLVIHRDLKPSNVLVTSDGVPKLLDFGIAKVFDDAVNETTVNLTLDVAPMTPQYASPEQVRGEPMTTATDVYSLGVVLYRLLTGQHPYRFTGNAQELAKAICEQDSPKPSLAVQPSQGSTGFGDEFARELRGDLDNITLKALHKEPQRRYSSALEFADDIERYLVGKPIRARQDTAWYRAGKFVGRHKVAVTMAALSITMLIAAFAVTAFQYRVAELERQRAQRRFNEVRQLANTFIFDIHDSIQKLPGSTTARQKLVETASQYLDNLARESESDRALQRELAGAYDRLAEIQGGVGQANLGDGRASHESRRRALAIREALSKADPSNEEARLEWAIGLSELALQTSGPDAVEMARKAVDMIEPIHAAAPKLEWGMRLAGAYYVLGSTYVASGKFDEGVNAFNKDADLTEELIRQAPRDGGLYRDLALVSKRIGAMLGSRGNYDEAFKRYGRALEIEQEYVRYRPMDVDARRSLSVTYSDLGWLSNRSGNPKAAMENHKKALEIRQALADADPANIDMKDRLAHTLGVIGSLLQDQKDWSKAENYFRQALALREQIAKRDPSGIDANIDLASAYGDLGSLALSAKNFGQALQFNERALEIAKNASAKDTANRDARMHLASAHGSLGITYFEWASTRTSDAERCQALEHAFVSLSEGTNLLLTLKQTGQLTNVEETGLEEFTRTLRETDKRLTQSRTAGLCAKP
jgi:non-specific serine/threonine protein kinase/serine/threonine-protein kinase